MASNNYFPRKSQDFFGLNSQRPSPFVLEPFTVSNSYAPSNAPSYHSTDPREYSSRPPPPPPPKESKTFIPMTEEIPMKNTSRLKTTEDPFRDPPNTYPPSPESQNPAPLLPSKSRRKRKRGFFAGKVPWFVYFMTLVQLTVFVVEIIKNSIITGSPIMIKPQFNPMIGPSVYVQINMGARFVPCMRTTPGVQDVSPTRVWSCPNTTTTDASDPSNQCSLSQLCGLGGLNYTQPNQWYRFITPMFLHAGIIHIGFNMLLQMTMGRDMEKAIGSVRFALVYLSSGIFGFVLGGNYAATGIVSTGASGCLFGILALVLLDLLYTWKERKNPGRELMWIIFDIVISFVLGLLPGLDNFSHIGGFLMGLTAGVFILHSPSSLRHRMEDDAYRDLGSEPDLISSNGALPHASRSAAKNGRTTSVAKPADLAKFAKEPVTFFKGRKPLWWAWWLIRAGALLGVLISFVVLLTNFYKERNPCHWCRYLSCLDITVNGQNWCDLGNLKLNGTSSNNKRELLRSLMY